MRSKVMAFKKNIIRINIKNENQLNVLRLRYQFGKKIFPNF